MNMLNSLELLIIVAMVLIAASLLALCLMFLVRNQRIKKVSFYIVAALGIYMGYIGFRIGSFLFLGQTVMGIVVAAAGAAAIALAVVGKNNERMVKIAQLVAVAALLVGFINAFLF